ncbi:hypothetical protein QBC44DRAFT_311524 [Cladorrhinum sp. PSN332]|nr:hypothetical protein QBC44DRAFT_311524 [Cladorrhinum sp. PSN332]
MPPDRPEYQFRLVIVFPDDYQPWISLDDQVPPLVHSLIESQVCPRAIAEVVWQQALAAPRHGEEQQFFLAIATEASNRWIHREGMGHLIRLASIRLRWVGTPAPARRFQRHPQRRNGYYTYHPQFTADLRDRRVRSWVEDTWSLGYWSARPDHHAQVEDLVTWVRRNETRRRL